MSGNMNYATLVDVLRWRAGEHPGRIAYIFLNDGKNESDQLDYSRLERRVRSAAALLQQYRTVGERILLLYPPGLDYIVSFLGCLYAGAIAVPAYPPRPNHPSQRIENIITDCKPAVILTSTQILDKVRECLAGSPDVEAIKWLSTDNLDEDLANEWREAAIRPDDLAFLQYTSGSTAAPKGVMVTHQNLMSNEEGIKQACHHTEESTFAGWLPLYHDMGLIGNVLQPLYIGALSVLMPPSAFLNQPVLWLQAIAHYRAFTSGGPNFAYDLCVSRTTLEERSRLDLSCWKVAFNGAEPIRQESLDRFTATFEQHGFHRKSFFPCYGLAESTLFVTGTSEENRPSTPRFDPGALATNQITALNDNDRRSRCIVSCGRALANHKVAIVDPMSLEECSPGSIGEIWVSGPSIASGYWNRQEESERIFKAKLAKAAEENSFLRTGDLGLQDLGELYVTGRLKDLIIIRGRNHYPQDIELTVERSHSELRLGCGAAFSVDVGNEEQLVVVQELKSRHPSNLAQIINKIRQAIADEHEVAPNAVALIRTGSIFKTSSGKIQRHLCRRAFLEGTLDVIQQWQQGQTLTDIARDLIPPPNLQDPKTVLKWLRSAMAALVHLPLEEVDADQPIVKYGLDSLAAVELSHTVQTGLGLLLPLSSFLEGLSLSGLANEIVTGRWQGVIENQRASPAAQADRYSLSLGQMALFYLDQRNPQSAAYNISRAVRIGPAVDIQRLQRGLQNVVDRQAILRTTIAFESGKVTQRVHPQMGVQIKKENASQWEPTLFAERLRQEAYRPFDLFSGPLLRVTLFDGGNGERILLLSVHHIIADLWSIAVLWRELEVFYKSDGSKEATALPPLKFQYVDYIQWQERLLASDRGAQLRAYWETKLAGGLPVLQLPFSALQADIDESEGATIPLKLSRSLTEKLAKISLENEVTLFTLLLAAYYALLHRYTTQDKIVIGSPTSGRTRADFSSLIGYFINTLPFVADLSGNPSFKEFLKQVKQTVMEGFDRQEFPWASMVERPGTDVDAHQRAAFQAIFVLQKAPQFAQEGFASLVVGESGTRLSGALDVEIVALENRNALFDLVLTLADNDGRFSGTFQYRKKLFEPSAIQRLSGHFQTLLEHIVQVPEQPIAELGFLTTAEREELLTQSNHLPETWRNGRTLPELFESVVEQHEGLIAVTWEKESLTYGQLNRKSSQLAHALQRAGVGPETLVGILLEPSLDLVIAVIATLKAGGAYVPIDPLYPEQRQTFLLADSHVQALITRAEYSHRLPSIGLSVILLNDELIDKQATCNPVNHLQPDNLAYIIYTSGSTGTPKGVMVTHANVQRLLAATQSWGNFGRTDVWTLFHSYAFDFSVWEIWGALLYGGRLVIVPTHLRRIPELLYRVLTEERVTILNQTPSAFRNLAEYGSQPPPPSLRLVIFGGEALDFKILRPWFKGDQHNLQFINMYGITETTVHVTRRVVGQQDIDTSGSTIGRPIPDLRIYVLDEHLELRPAGIPGEIFVGGDGLARGYLNRPELTAERFVPDPFSKRPGDRVYASGDLARRIGREDLEYLGRKDNQVKIRGFRIELPEIEAVLNSCPGVRESIVAALESPIGKKLVAYLVTENGSTPSDHEIRGFLNARLPEYMMPSALVRLESMPLTPSGKVDRKRLPDLLGRMSDPSDEHIEVRNEEEEVLAGIWADVLGRPNVGVSDDFFELGGDSIRSIQVVARARERGINISLAQLFKCRTVGELIRAAKLVEAVDPEEQRSDQAFDMLSPEDRKRMPLEVEDAYPLTRVQLGLVFHSEHSADYEIYVTSFHLQGDFNQQAMEQAVRHVFSRHAMLRTYFDLASYSRPLQLVKHEAEPVLAIHDWRLVPTADQDALIHFWLETRRKEKMNWGKCPLVQFDVHLRSNNTFQFTLSEPFLDGWSAASLLTEVMELHFSAAAGNASAPGDSLATSFRKYVLLERAAVQSKECQGYWQEKLRDCKPTHLPERARSFEHHGGMTVERINVPISNSLSKKLRMLARSAAVPLKSVLMAAHFRVISFLCSQVDVLTGVLYNGRPEAKDAERVPGLFLNTLPCRMQMSGGTWMDLCERVFALEQELLPFRRYPLAELLRNRDRQPLFDTVFNFTYFHIYEGLSKLANLKVLNAYASEHTYFDLTVQFNLDHSTREPQLRLALDYRRSRFSEAQVLKIGSCYLSAMTAMVENPHSDYRAAFPAVPSQSDVLLNQPAIELPLLGHSENLEEVLRRLEPLSDGDVQNLLLRKRALRLPQNA